MKYNTNSFKHLKNALIEYSNKSLPTVYNYLSFRTPIPKNIALKLDNLGFKMKIWTDKKYIKKMKLYDKKNHLKI
jgi:hypothetical protein